jgi:hypothetical protein
MCKNHSQKLATYTRQISIQTDSVIQLRLQIQSGLRKQILFESVDPVDVTFSSWFLHFVQHRQCLSALQSPYSRSEQNNCLFITRFYFFKTMFFHCFDTFLVFP